MLTLLFLHLFCLVFSITNSKYSLYMSILMMSFSSLYSLLLLNFPFIMMKSYTTSYIVVDSISGPLISLSCWISSLMLLALFLSESENLKFTIVFLNFILILCFSASTSILFYILFELSLIPTFFLVISSSNPERYKAAIYMLLYMIFSSLPLLVLLIGVYSFFGTSFLHFHFLMNNLENFTPNSFVWIIVFLPFLAKLPIFGLHIWLPKAHVEAPLVGSMILAGILLKLGGYGLARFLYFFNFQGNLISDFILSLSLVGGVLSCLICFRQEDIKAFIAYSSVGHMGLVLASFLSMTTWGWKGAVMMMISHGLCSSALFVLASQCFDMMSSRSLLVLKAGSITIVPKLSFWWFLFCVINAGVPPSLNFFSEIFMYSSIVSMNKWFLIPLLFLVFFSGLYNISLYMTTQHGSSYSELVDKGVPLSLYLILMGHFFPLITLFLKMEVMLVC